MGITFPGESAEYRAARDRLLEAELGLRRQREAAAAARRALPAGGEVAEDYAFTELDDAGERRQVRLSELFEDGKDTLAIYHFMYPRSPGTDLPCPGCTGFLDMFDGTAGLARDRLNVVVVAKAPIEKVAAYGKERGWNRLRLLSSEGTSFNRDYNAEEPNGQQAPMTNVFRREGGTIRHFWGSELLYAETDPGQDPRHNDLMDPLMGLLDITPEGRGD